jgi:hypothetical protein
MKEKQLKELSINIRKNIIGLIELWSSKEEQLEYQKNVPIAQVSAELFCQWDDYYHPETKAHKLAFSEKETEIIDLFYQKIELVSEKKNPEDWFTYIDDFILTNDWIELNKLAKETLNNLNSKKNLLTQIKRYLLTH